MRKTLGLLLLCGGCAATPIDELYVQHARCVASDATDCESIWQKIERREAVLARRDAKIRCRAGSVQVGDADGREACVSYAETLLLLGQRVR